jgi:hypothetical protein
MNSQNEDVVEISIDSIIAKKEIIKISLEIYERAKRCKDPSDEQIAFIHKGLEHLEVHERCILIFKFWGNYSVKEIARKFEAPECFIEKIMKEAINRLRLHYIIEFSAPKSSVNPMIPLEEIGYVKL